jgi:glutamyl-tRNA reductase
VGRILGSNGRLGHLRPETLNDLDKEPLRAEAFGPYSSSHEAFAVIKEELDELWEEIKEKESERNPSALYEEAMQVAATALKYADQIKGLWRPNSEATTP